MNTVEIGTISGTPCPPFAAVPTPAAAAHDPQAGATGRVSDWGEPAGVAVRRKPM